MVHDRVWIGLGVGDGLFSRSGYFSLGLSLQLIKRFLRGVPSFQNQSSGSGDGVPGILGRPLFLSTVHPLIVGHGVRVGTNYVSVQECRASPRPDVIHRLSSRFKSIENVGAVALPNQQVREIRDESGNAPSSGLHLDASIAELRVRFDDGKERRLLRKVAVVR